MAKVEVKFGEWIEKGFNLYKENFGVLVLATLLWALLSLATAGLLLGPLTAGMLLIVLRLVDKDETKPEAGDLFKGFSFFAPTLLFMLVWGAISIVATKLILIVITCAAPIAIPVLSLCLGTLLMFALFLIVDRNMAFWPASMESIQLVKENFLPLLGLHVVASAIGGLGGVLCGVGSVFTIPITFCILAVAYREITAVGTLAEEDAAPAPEAAEPAGDA